MLYLPIAFSDVNTCADAKTSYIILQGKCLQLNYMTLDQKTWGSIEVFLSDENLELEFVDRITFASLPQQVATQWQSWITRLPDREGLRQVIIKSIRPANRYTGMAIDDLSIRPCPDFSKFPKIMSHFILY